MSKKFYLTEEKQDCDDEYFILNKHRIIGGYESYEAAKIRAIMRDLDDYIIVVRCSDSKNKLK